MLHQNYRQTKGIYMENAGRRQRIHKTDNELKKRKENKKMEDEYGTHVWDDIDYSYDLSQSEGE